MIMEKFRSKGIMKFALSDNFDLVVSTKTDDEIVSQSVSQRCSEEMRQVIKDGIFTHEIYTLIPGLKFLEMVRDRTITDDDGLISEMFVDGFQSNLGLCEAGFCQNGFLVTGNIFASLCERHDIMVNWANK